MLTRDQAVCIRAVDYSESSQVVTFFSRAHGKIGAMAKGSKRPKSAFDGPIEVLSFGDIVITDPHHDKLATLTEYRQEPLQGGLRRNLFALHSALFAAELVNRFTHEDDPHPVLFDQFVAFLQDVDEGGLQGRRRDILLRLILFQLSLLHEVGLRPNFKSCANCRRAFSAAWRESYFSSRANGLVCQDCEMSFHDRRPLSPRAVNGLANLRQLAQAPEAMLDEIEAVLIHHLTETLGRPPRMAKHILNTDPR